MLQDDSDYAELINQNFLFRFIELRNELRCAALPCSPLLFPLLSPLLSPALLSALHYYYVTRHSMRAMMAKG